MRNTVEVKLPYVDNRGKDKEYVFKIGFVSNRITRDYRELQEEIQKLLEITNSIKELEGKLQDKIGSITTESTEEEVKRVNKEIDKISSDIEKISKKAKSIDYTEFFNKRFDLIKRILIRNGYNDGKQYLTFKFWDENVDPGNILEFLKSCVFKDVPKK